MQLLTHCAIMVMSNTKQPFHRISQQAGVFIHDNGEHQNEDTRRLNRLSRGQPQDSLTN
jgi:hypothetical protein